MGEGVAMLFRGAGAKPEPYIEILCPIAPLIRDVWRIVDHRVKDIGSKWHHGIVATNGGTMMRVYVQTYDLPRTVAPESATVDCRIENPMRTRG